jgi:hypothetical protein
MGIRAVTPLPSRAPIWGGILLTAAALLQRLWLWTVYAPVEYGDTGAYFRAAAVLARGTLRGYDGTRVPGYPAFVAAWGLDPTRVWLGQMALGLGITLILYVWTLRTSRSPTLAIVVASLYNLIPGQFLFEANLLTETLTTFSILLSLYLVSEVGRRSPGKTAAWLAFAGGLAAGAAGLVRILFYPLAAWLLPFVWTAAGTRKSRLVRSAWLAVPAAILLGGWVYYIYSSYGFLAPSTMGGYNLVQHTGGFFEYLPDEYAPLRDTYLKYRDARVAERGDQTNTIWEAIPELSAVTGLGFYDLSREMQRVSLLLIREHPDLYARNVVEGWVSFWKAPVYWDPEHVASPLARRLLSSWSTAGRVICLAANAVYLALMAALLFPTAFARRLRRDSSWLLPAGLVGLTSVVQTLIDHGDNPRFLVPLQMVVFMTLALALARALERRPREIPS